MMKEILRTILTLLAVLGLFALIIGVIVLLFTSRFATGAKPVIYLYPTETTEVSVKVEVEGKFTSTYPNYNDGWTVTAQPDGTLTDGLGREYYCLFWEALLPAAEMDFDEGWCVKGEDTAAFLEEMLREIGLTDKEANEFIIYWLPRMEHNAYNLISFQTEAYEDVAKLSVVPQPDSMLRVFMTWKPVAKPVELEPQTIAPFVREGFTVVEWGGMEK